MDKVLLLDILILERVFGIGIGFYGVDDLKGLGQPLTFLGFFSLIVVILFSCSRLVSR